MSTGAPRAPRPRAHCYGKPSAPSRPSRLGRTRPHAASSAPAGTLQARVFGYRKVRMRLQNWITLHRLMSTVLRGSPLAESSPDSAGRTMRVYRALGARTIRIEYGRAAYSLTEADARDFVQKFGELLAGLQTPPAPAAAKASAV